jgi:hypothetical protein
MRSIEGRQFLELLRHSASWDYRPRPWRTPQKKFLIQTNPFIKSPFFKASRKRVYEAAMQRGGSLGLKPTEISRKVGGTFTLFGGHIIGRHLELVPFERIVQAWRVVDWGPGWYSIAKFELVEQGADTKIVFDHLGFPKGLGQQLADGWKGHYWDTLRKYLA